MGEKPKLNDNYKVVPFNRDVDYYFQKGNSHFYKNNWSKALLYFNKAIEIEPNEPINYYNLGCLLSKMGELEEANKTFEYILEKLDDSYWECYFLLAINYGLMEEFERAQSYLQKYLRHSPDGEMIVEAQELLWALTEDELALEEELDEQLEEQLFKEYKEEILLDITDLETPQFVRKYEGNDYLLQVLQKLLYQGQDSYKEEIINILEYINSRDTLHILREFVRNPWVQDRHKQMALLKLKNISSYETCQVFFNGEFQEVNLAQSPLQTPFWKDEWQRVLRCTLDNMQRSNNYRESYFADARDMWINFINHKMPHVPRITKCETWAAALEYSMARSHFLNVTQKEIANKYGVSSASVSAKFKTINEILQVDG